MSQSQEDDFTSVRKRIAVKIRLLRACRGLSQEALAQKSGLSTRHLQKLEAGQVNVTVESLSKLSKALEVDISRLFAQSVEETR
jgi:transcriptional regulator with XRE-family HTH domain